MIEYLYEGEDNKYCYDKKYALRICLQEKKNDASIFLYCAQQMYDEAVEMTLSINDYDMDKKLNMAKKIANDVTDDDDKKRLWLMILKYIIEVCGSPAFWEAVEQGYCYRHCPVG